MPIKVKYIDIEIDKRTLTLNLNQVHALRDELNRAFPEMTEPYQPVWFRRHKDSDYGGEVTCGIQKHNNNPSVRVSENTN